MTKEKEAIGKATSVLRERLPWLESRPEARLVAYLATFPRSVAGDKQGDPLLRRIWLITQIPCDDVELTRRAIVETVNAGVAPHEELIEPESDDPPLYQMAYELDKFVRGQPPEPKSNSEFFSLIANHLRHLETYEPTARDYGVEELQNAFVGLMQRKYEWGKKGFPTKGKVIEMAKERLKHFGKKSDFSKSSWSELLQVAELDWLPAGRAGRPSKARLDENVKAEREYKSLCTQAIKDFYGGDPKRARDSVKAAYGSAAEHRRDEEDRLRAIQPRSEEELE